MTFAITQRAITVTAVINSKPYDGNISSAGVPTFSPALIAPDSPSFIQTFDNRNAWHQSAHPKRWLCCT